MSRVLRIAAQVILVGALTVACSSSGQSSSAGSSSSASALCGSVDSLQRSINALQDVQVGKDGTDALKSALGTVRSDVQDVVADAKAQYSSQADAVRADAAAVQTAVDGAKRDPSSASITAIRTAVATLADDARTLAHDVSSSC